MRLIAEFIHSLTSNLGNQFVSGGLVLMVTGSLLALCRELPSRLWKKAKRLSTCEVIVRSNDPLFDYVTFWLDSQPKFNRARHVRAVTDVRAPMMKTDDGDNGPFPSPPDAVDRNRKPLRVFFSPAFGFHNFIYSGRLFGLSRHREEKSAPLSTGGRSERTTIKDVEEFTIVSPGRNPAHIKRLITDIVEFGTRPQEGTRIFFSTWGNWSSNGLVKMRPVDSVIMPTGVMEKLLAQVRAFQAGENWYREMGIPWHLGCLFHGVPGSGKSSLAAALAGELGLNLYLLNIGGSGMDDDRLISLMTDIRPGSMVVLEDVDCTAPDRESAGPEKTGSAVTLSGLLNCLDGIMSREGCVIVMTTNHAGRLDTALVRPGRVDIKLEFGFATQEQKERLAGRVGGVVPEGDNLTMAEVQQKLLDGRTLLDSISD